MNDHSQPGRNDANQPYDSKKKLSESIDRLQKTVASYAAERRSDKNEQELKERAREKRELIATFATWIYTGITFLLLLVGFYQVLISRRVEIAGERAWLRPNRLTFSSWIEPGPLVINGSTSNIGKEPALDVIFSHPDGGFLTPKTLLADDIKREFLADAHFTGRNICSGVVPEPENVIYPGVDLPYERTAQIQKSDYPSMKNVLNGISIFMLENALLTEHTARSTELNSAILFAVIRPTEL